MTPTPPEDSLVDWFREAMTPVDQETAAEAPRRWLWTRAAFQATAASAIFAVVLVVATLPLTGITVESVRSAKAYWDSLPSRLPAAAVPEKSYILAADGSRIAQFYSENRAPVSIDQIPKVMQTAIISIEDSRFYQHGALDFRGTLRALAENLTGKSTQGGSTLEQQYVKNVLLNSAKTQAQRNEATSQTSYLRKLRELKYASRLAQTTSKPKILEDYLNISYFGGGAYGISAAAKHYFSVPVQQLDLPQSALLAGLVQSPTAYDPSLHPQAALQRRNVVLFRMRQLGHISEKQYQHAAGSPLHLHLSDPRNGCVGSRYPFFCQWIQQQLQTDPVFGGTDQAREQLLYRGGLTIRTSLVPKWQDAAQRATDTVLGRMNRVAASAVTVQPGTGKVVSMAVNRGFGSGPGKTEVLLPVVPAYQPGSNFKPFTLATALERGYPLQTVYDVPPVYYPPGMNTPIGGFTNLGSAENGPMTASTALWRSSNNFFVHLEWQYGVVNVAHMAQRLGITSLPLTGKNAIGPRDGSLTLGTYDVSPLQMAGAYATFAAHGVHCTPIGIVSITDPTGKKIAVPPADCHQAISAGVADTVASVMQGTIDGPDPYRTGATVSIGRPAAGKTGTTENNAAVWFSGYTPQYATSVVAADPRGGARYPLRGIYANGVYIAQAYGYLVGGPIWKAIMSTISSSLPVEKFAPADPATVAGQGQVVPDVRGLAVTQAIQLLGNSGYGVRILAKHAPPDTLFGPNHVSAVLPSPGSPIGFGQTVTLRLSARSTVTQALVPGQFRPKPGGG